MTEKYDDNIQFNHNLNNKVTNVVVNEIPYEEKQIFEIQNKCFYNNSFSDFSNKHVMNIPQFHYEKVEYKKDVEQIENAITPWDIAKVFEENVNENANKTFKKAIRKVVKQNQVVNAFKKSV